MFSNLSSGFVGTGELWPAEMLGTEISDTQLCNYRLVGFDEAHVCSYGRAGFGMIFLPLI
jgi:hypothetical protein